MGVKVVRQLPKYARALQGGLGETMQKAALYMQSSANQKIKKGVAPENAPLTKKVKGGDRTLRDSNALAASIAPHSGPSWADASTNLKYARIQQEGGVIRSKRAKALYIPAGPKTRQLMRQYNASSPGDLIGKMEADGYEFFYTRLSKVLYAKKKRGQPFLLFILRRSVKLPARPYLYHDDADERFILNLIRRSVRKKLEDANGKNT